MLVVQVAHPQASDVLIKQLAYENANADCKKALASIKEKGSLSEFIQVCHLWGPKNISKEFLQLP
jgi:hypothetical protein